MAKIQDLLEEMSRRMEQMEAARAQRIQAASGCDDSARGSALGLLNPTGQDPFGLRAMLMRKIMNALQETMGFKTLDKLQIKLNQILHHLGDQQLSQWYLLMETCNFRHPEWQDLIEQITVHETYFYRDPDHLQFFLEAFLNPLIQQRAKQGFCEIRAWSAGCSTGEETYTLAMMILFELSRCNQAIRNFQGELQPSPAWVIEVLGSDISNQALQRATRGYYTNQGMSSFRNFPQQFEQFVTPLTGPEKGPFTHQVRANVRNLVSFVQNNLKTNPAPVANMDFVFCRNVLIYFPDAIKREIQGKFAQVLKPGGVLVMGSTDINMQPDLFEAVSRSGLVIFRRK